MPDDYTTRNRISSAPSTSLSSCAGTRACSASVEPSSGTKTQPLVRLPLACADPSAVDRATWLLWVAHNLERSADVHLLTRRGVRN
jgi:hypothetical protein